jgi:hypothetical protein
MLHVGWRKHFRMVAALVVVIASLAAASRASADTAVTWTGGGVGFHSQLSVGFKYFLSDDIVVTELGIYDFGGDGLANTTAHEVGIFDAGGTLISPVITMSGTNEVLDEGYRWVDVTPFSIFLPAGGPYTIASTTAEGVYITDNLGATPYSSLTFGPGVTWAGSVFQTSTGPDYPLVFPAASVGAVAYFNPNFRYVPEPASALLLAGGAALLAARRRRV